MIIRNNQKRIFIELVIFSFLLIPTISLASTSDGTIQTQYAWGENVGWINFLPTGGNVHVTDTALSGNAWDANYGWMSLAPAQSGVKNDGAGNLSGYAWSQGGGYINFTGVTINSSGKFTGTANGTVYGRITFDCSQCNVTTDWRPVSSRATPTPAPIGSSGSRGYSSSFLSSILGYFFPITTSSNSDNQNVEANGKPKGSVDNVENLSTKSDQPNPVSSQNDSIATDSNQIDESLVSQDKASIWSSPIMKIIAIIALVILLIWVVLKFVVFKV